MNSLFSTALFDQPDSLQQFKQLLKDNQTELQQKFDPHRSVSKLLKERAAFIDALLSCCWQHFLGNAAQSLSLIAVGGYGRRELFPYSDIDIVILLPSNDTTLYRDDLSAFSTFLWDIGLKPGQSVRTVSQCIALARDEQTIMTSLLESRLLTGNKSLCQQLKQGITPDKMWASSAFFAAKMEEQRQRYAKYHGTAYNLEPNVKEGPGGLRDRQVIAWVFKRHYNSSTLKELIKYGFMPESEYDELMAALNVLWRIRYALHLLTQRGEDRLIFDYQRDLARQFGFSAEHQSYNQDVELFMQFYFKTVQGLERLNEMLLQLFQERFVCGETGEACEAVTINDEFVSINDYLEARHEQVFVEQPLALLEIFLLLQQHPHLKGIRATTIRLIRKHLHLIDEDFRRNKAANRLFVSIFRQPQGISHQLKRMNRYGILAAYLPSFAPIVARMQYDLFHIYTVDEHTIFVIGNCRKFSLPEYAHELPFCNDVFVSLPKPEILYISALFHDIAKGRNTDHSILGEEIARDFCLQHDLSIHDTKLIAWLVRHHLVMSMTAQRKDISDPEVIHEFAQTVGNLEYLHYLYLLTVADIRGTNPDLWNSWKDVLLKELYNATHQALRHGLPSPNDLVARLRESKQEAKDELIKLGLSEDLIDAAWQHANDDYFLRYSADEIAWHTIAIASCDEAELPLVLLRPQTLRGSAEVFIYTKDEEAIFSLSTATFGQLGLTILEARIMTTLDGYVLNSFQVLEQSGEAIHELFREIHICNALRQNLQQRMVRGHKNIHKLSRQAKHFPIPTTVTFHADPLNRYSIIELVSTDCAGLLSQVGFAFVEQGVYLHNAKITTIGARVEDMFYVTDKQEQPIIDSEKQAQIRLAIMNALEVHDCAS